jgi:hypothetical protein
VRVGAADTTAADGVLPPRQDLPDRPASTKRLSRGSRRTIETYREWEKGQEGGTLPNKRLLAYRRSAFPCPARA